jgi:hypothetical protein
LISEQGEDRVAAHQDSIEMADSYPFFKKIMTCNKSWCFAYDSGMKRQSSALLEEKLPGHRKFDSRSLM